MKLHVSNLTNRALDYAVAIAIGEPVEWLDDFQLYGVRCVDDPIACEPLKLYSSDWAHGGPLIDDYIIDFETCVAEGDIAAEAPKLATTISLKDFKVYSQYGGHHLEASCRAIVASKLGEWVNVPDDLVNDEYNA